MERFFNIAGPIKKDIHYYIEPLNRLEWDEIQLLLNQQSYFVLHAPRQTGKTTTLLAMAEVINKADNQIALYANIESAQASRNDIQSGINTICADIANQAVIQLKDESLNQWLIERGNSIPANSRLNQLLSFWSQSNGKPCLLLLDEIDALIGDTLISVLRQIRAGYPQRPAAFPQNIILCGVRDVRDYRIHSQGEIITGGSVFNIKSESLRMGSFSQTEIQALYAQHSKLTGQEFESDVFNALWQDTQGQPWLVNALAYQTCFKNKANRDRNKTITLEDYKIAREQLIYARTTHLDQLSDKLKEPRVHAVIAPMLSSLDNFEQAQSSLDDLQYVEDLGLIKLKPNLVIANKIYQEVIPRELTYPTSVNITHEQAWYIGENDKIDMRKLLSAFQQFFRENIDAWSENFQYKEAGPQLLMQAFLQRIVNGGGRITREYALGRKRTDLLIEWPLTEQSFNGPVQRVVIELKILYGAIETTIENGVKQACEYANSVNADEVHLVIFDRSTNNKWDDRIWCKRQQVDSCIVDVWGC